MFRLDFSLQAALYQNNVPPDAKKVEAREVLSAIAEIATGRKLSDILEEDLPPDKTH